MALKTVRDIFLDALAMKRERVRKPHEIASRLMVIGHENGFERIIELGSADGGLELLFEATGEIIRFDGRNWHHDRG